MMIFVDSGAWVALAKKNDVNHQLASVYFRQLLQERAALVTSNYVIAESATRLLYDLGHRKAMEFRETIIRAQQEHFLSLQWVDEDCENRAWEVFSKYADQAISIFDCTSFVIARRLGINTIFSFDKDFAILGLNVEPKKLPG